MVIKDVIGYLFLGDDEQSKKSKVSSFKSALLDNASQATNFETIYSNNKELTPPKFNEVLSFLPVNLSQKRLIHIKNIESLSSLNRQVLVKYLKAPSQYLVLLLDSAVLTLEDNFIKEIKLFVQHFDFGRKKEAGVFDLTRAVVKRQSSQALQVLNFLLNNKNPPEAIVGGLFWQWENLKDKINNDKYNEGLKAILDTDIRIKTGVLKERLALELLVIRLARIA